MIRPLLVAASTLAITPLAHAETRALSGFDAVSASGKLQVEISQGAAHSVRLDGPRASEVISRVRDGRLELETPRTWFGLSNSRTHVRITMPSVRALSASAGAEMEARDMRADALALDSSSGAELTVTGTCGALSADASSGADLDARGLRCSTANVDSSSGADAYVQATELANVDASSGSDIYLTGGARIGGMDVSSGADVHRR